MQLLESLERNWSLILVWVTAFLLITLYFEYKRMDAVWFFKKPSKFFPKMEYYYTYADYLKWWVILLNNPEDVVISIRNNFVSFLETEHPDLKNEEYLPKDRERERVIPFLNYIKDEELKKFLLDPLTWIKPYLYYSELNFLKEDKEIMFLRLSALTSVFYDIHKRIHEESGHQIGREWLKLIDSNEDFQQKYNRKLWIKTIKFMIMATILILLGGISSYFIITDEPLAPIVIVVVLILVILFVSLTTFFQRFIQKKALDRILRLRRKTKLSNQNTNHGEN
ncbi:MAG: hypothetical protein ACW981_13080 [Candidatus Hodarchaeales archaeon]|jgi:hypothetical protein